MMSETQQRKIDGYRGQYCQRCRKLGKNTPITSDEAQETLEELGFSVCPPCAKIGRDRGFGRKDNSRLSPTEHSRVSPSLQIVRDCCRKLDALDNAEQITLQADSEVLNKEVGNVMLEAIKAYANYRIMELRL